MDRRAIGSYIQFLDDLLPKVVEFLQQRGYEWKWDIAMSNPVCYTYMETWTMESEPIDGDDGRILPFDISEVRRVWVLRKPNYTGDSVSLRDICYGLRGVQNLPNIIVEASLVKDIRGLIEDIPHRYERFYLQTDTMHRIYRNPCNINIVPFSDPIDENPEFRKLLSI